MLATFTPNERRSLAIMTIVALGFGAYFLRHYLVLIAFAAVLAYLFQPIYRWLVKRMSSGLASFLTLLSAILIVGVPLAGIFTMAGIQIAQMVSSVRQWLDKTDLTKVGQHLLDSVNGLIAKVPFVHVKPVSLDTVRDWVSNIAEAAGKFALGLARDSAGGLATTVTMAIIFLYVFLALMTNASKVVELFKDLNPLGPEVSDIYLEKIGSMVTATVRGQFVIAFVQGLLGAISIYVGGIHQAFFMFVIFLTVLSIIPLGSGIVTMPLGIGMALTGNIVGGLFVFFFHLIVITNVDNFLRPMLVPRNAHLHPALMLLAVFAGMQMFGFAGIVFGPVLMIIIVTTVNMYRSVYKGATWVDDFESTGDDDESRKPSLWQRIRHRGVEKRADRTSSDPISDIAGASGDG
ncbi:AI-2E family transporter [Gordonia sp. X0973]|uniref:AI-2E family transporter n=1 Tax=Gordonia sp. X0973 TaxID=2742602 RepID=UPI000F51EB16|nr:AI-2E family transporter [Gordonia sp. X0973]QKT06725.1 AI-2E family transporter [Gordonia sp. X0973]